MEKLTTAQAAELIKTALASGSIKLQQAPSGTEQYSKQSAEVDATYLLTLLHQLTKAP